MKCRRFIGLGSQAEYGRYEGILREDTPVFPENGYGMAKLAAGQLSRLRCEQLKIEHIWTRVLSVYGPYDTGQSMIMSVIGELLCGTSPKTTAGEQIWDYLYAKDAATALRLLGERGEPGELYCLGSGRGIPLRRYIHAIEQAVGNSQKVKLGALAYSDAQVMHLQADVSKLKRDTGFVPDFSFEEGIRETVKWYMDQEETNLICEK